MSSSPLNLEDYRISLEEINFATEDFNPERCIGGGGFGKVYRGELSDRWQNRTAAIKRLDQDSYQGEHEFHNEVQMICKFQHKNIVSFIGYCDEGNEMIIVYEYAVNRSLDRHLQDPNKRCCITWIQRLKICIGAAKGLKYLHSGLGEHNRVIHRDVKSANILLDDSFVPKICDFGLSKFGLRNEPDTYLHTKVAGTQFYMDPGYNESGILHKESDVYSFGVVLFEMLSGMLVYHPRNFGNDWGHSLIYFVRRYYHNELDKLIDPQIKDQIDSRAFDTFKQIAYQCISLNLTERPTMDTVIERIEEALSIEKHNAALIECVMEDIGFSHGIPVAAFTIYKCLLSQKYLKAERTTTFDLLINVISSAIEGFRSSRSCEDLSHVTLMAVQQVETKNPALLFKQQLTEYVEKVYCIINDNLKKELISLLDLCIQAPRKFKGVPVSRISIDKYSQSSYWQGIVDHLNTLLNILKQNFVPPIIIQKIFANNFSYINVELFNSLLQRRECCTDNNGEYVKAGLVDLENWCYLAKEEYAGSAWDKLKHVRQAIGFLTRNQKHMISYDEITNDLCPILSIQQLYRLCSFYWGDNTQIVSSNIFSSMRVLMTEESTKASSSSFLLNECSSIPVSIDDISTSFQVKDFENVVPALLQLSKYGAFHFLYN